MIYPVKHDRIRGRKNQQAETFGSVTRGVDITLDYKRNKSYFVGIDSDGTAFDSMTVKHRAAFIPAMLRVWRLESHKTAVCEIAERINLYSLERGVNRFPGLVRVFDELKNSLGARFDIGDYEALREFTVSDFPMSNAGLRGFMEKNNAKILEDTLVWSLEADSIFTEKVRDLPPFAALPAALDLMSQTADLMVVSAASTTGLLADWGRAKILDKINFVAGQEFGLKSSQLEFALNSGYAKNKSLMIGDGIGDYEAARENGIHFYPIIPSKENECWQKLADTYYPMFLNGAYTPAVEDALYRAFFGFLNGDSPTFDSHGKD